MNIGDIGHTPGTLRLLERYIPEAEILLWHEQRRPITEAIVIKNFPKVKIVRGAFLGKDMQMEQELKEAFDKADVYIHNSGMNSVRRAPLLFNPYGLRLWATCRTQENKVCVFRQRWICSPMQTLQEIYTGEEQGNKP